MSNLTERYPALKSVEDEIQKALDLIIDVYENGGKVLVCGNGGSAADSDLIDERISEDLRCKLQGALPAISLPSQNAILSAYINDVEPDMMYAQLVYGYANENDLVMGISTSGNSKNIVNALKVANAVGAKTLALTGISGGALAEIADVLIGVPEHETYKVQEYHLPVYHYLCAEVERILFA